MSASLCRRAVKVRLKTCRTSAVVRRANVPSEVFGGKTQEYPCRFCRTWDDTKPHSMFLMMNPTRRILWLTIRLSRSMSSTSKRGAVGACTVGSADYILRCSCITALLAESLEVIQKTLALIPPPPPKPRNRVAPKLSWRWPSADHLDISASRRVAPRPVPQDLERSRHRARDRSRGRVRSSGLPALSVAHYNEQNSDVMRDPELPVGGQGLHDAHDPQNGILP